MITFITCFVVLIASYFIYGGYLQRVFGADGSRSVPSKDMFDGVDYVPMPIVD